MSWVTADFDLRILLSDILFSFAGKTHRDRAGFQPPAGSAARVSDKQVAPALIHKGEIILSIILDTCTNILRNVANRDLLTYYKKLASNTRRKIPMRSMQMDDITSFFYNVILSLHYVACDIKLIGCRVVSRQKP